MPEGGAYNLYLNWVLYAVVGRLREADTLLREERASILAIAAALRERLPPPPTQLYRGILLLPEEVQDGKVSPLPELTFTSWTEDREVASWFADPDSIISGSVKAQRPGVEGYLLSYVPQKEEILFHYSWDPPPFLGWDCCPPLTILALLHPFLCPFVPQLKHSLQTQQEVITLPPTSALPVEEYRSPGRERTIELDRKLTPPSLLPG